MATPLIIFGTLGMLLLIAHLWLQKSIEREKALEMSEQILFPDPHTSKIKVLEAIENAEGGFEKGKPGGLNDPQFSEEAKAIWPEISEEIQDFFERYPHGVSWEGLGYIGGNVKSSRFKGALNRLLNSHPEFRNALIIGGCEGEYFLVSIHSSKIGCMNAPLERIDFHESIYELLYSHACH